MTHYNTKLITEDYPISIIKKFIPTNCLCGPSDSVIGFKDDYFPFKKEELLNAHILKELLMPTRSLTINSCLIQIPSMFESRLHESIKNLYVPNKYSLNLLGYRIHIAVHNQWTYINTRGIKNSVEAILDLNSIKASGTLRVDEINNKSALVFQLVATFEVISPDHCVERLPVIVGEYLYIAKDDIHDTDVLSIYGKMNSDPEKALTGCSIWEPDYIFKDEDWSLMLTCELSFVTRKIKASIVESTINEEMSKLKRLKKQKEEERKALEAAKMKEYEEKKNKLNERSLRLQQEENDLRTQRDLLRSNPNYSQVMSSVASPNSLLSPSNSPELPFAVEKVKKKTQPPNIAKDMKNDLKASITKITFLGFKVKGRLLAFDNLANKNLCFMFKFFNFPFVQTQSLYLARLKSGPETTLALRLNNEIPNWTNSQSTDPEKLKLEFHFDPVTIPQLSLDSVLEEYLKYLAHDTLKIYVLDANGLIILGSSKIYLADLLRKDQPVKVLVKEYDVFNESKQLIGGLELQMENVGVKHGQVLSSNKSESKVVPKKTKIKSKPLTMKDLAKIPQMSSAYIKKEEPADLRRKTIVYKYKMHESEMTEKKRKPKWYNDTISEDIEKYRSINRQINISFRQPLKQQSEKISIVPYFLGHLIICPIQVINPYDEYTVFYIEIIDHITEFQLITSPIEWQYFISKTNHDPPFDWNILINYPKLSLNPKEQVILLFKMLCLTPPLKKEREIRVNIKVHHSSQVVQTNFIKLVYTETYYNDYFVCNESKSKSKVIELIPNIEQHHLEAASFLLCNDSKISIKIIEKSIHLRAHIENDKEIYVFAYRDEYYYETLFIVHVILYCYRPLDINTTAGLRLFENVSLENHEANKEINVYSSNPLIVKVAEGFSSVFELPKDESRSFPLLITPYRPGDYSEYIHCIGNLFEHVDKTNGRMQERIMLKIAALLPKAGRQLELKVKGQSDTRTEFTYTNPEEFRAVEFICSHPEVFKIIEPVRILKPNEVIHIGMIVRPSAMTQSSVLVYVVDKKEIPEVLLFIIKY